MPANAQRFYESVENDALHLSREERSKLIAKLQESLGQDAALSDEWISEIDSRADDIDSGRVQLIDGDEFMRRFRSAE